MRWSTLLGSRSPNRDELARRLHVEPGQAIEMPGYRWPPPRPWWVGSIAVLLATLALLGLMAAAVGEALGLLFALPLAVVLPVLRSLQRRCWTVRAGADGITLIDRAGRAETVAWLDLGELEREFSPAQFSSYCLKVGARCVYLRVSPQSEAVRDAAAYAARWLYEGKSAAVPEAALSRASVSATDADQARALSPAGPPDRCTESEDA